jgi:D-alanyl-D-alanine carboxypeptidase
MGWRIVLRPSSILSALGGDRIPMTRRITATFALLLLLFVENSAAARRRPVDRSGAHLATAAAAAVKPILDSGVPGVSVAVWHRGQIVYAAGFGQQRRGGPAVQPSTVHQVGSVTKQFTAAAIMRLVEEGSIALDDPVSKFVPELNTRNSNITVRHLLTHTSGLPEYTATLPDPFDELTEAEFFSRVNAGNLYFTPGSHFRYNNSGYYLLGLIVERVSKRALDVFVALELVAPAGLGSSGTCNGFAAPLAPAGSATINGGWIDTPPLHMSNAFGAGDLCSTATDLVKWSHALATGSVITPQSYATMTTPLRLTNGDELPYAFGLATHYKLGHRAVSHNGSILGFTSQLAYYPDLDLGVAVLINANPAPAAADIYAAEEAIAAAAMQLE